ncbi:MAG: histidinol-phosphate transaminase [Candidatus Altiarchaeales archaeon]|nr:histidinol-phosphate transaminase [Candidatus Altiarchaeales archaeon]
MYAHHPYIRSNVKMFELEESLKPWVKGLKPYVPGEMVEGKLKLASNENGYGASPKVVERVREAASRIHVYPYKDAVVQRKIAQYTGVDAKNIVLGNGSDELITLLITAFRGPVLGQHPSFAEYRLVSQILGQEYVEAPLDAGFSFNVEAYLEKKKEANLFFLCNPNNPTGTKIKRKDLIRVLNEGKPTVVDEAYAEFMNQDSVELLASYDNLIVLRTFAKSFGLAGLRLGYSISSPEIADALKKVKPPFNVNVLAQEAALAALDDIEYMRQSVSEIKKQRQTLFMEIAKKYRPTESWANFILFDVSPKKAGDVYQRLFEEGVIVRCFGEFKGFRGQYLRVTVGTRKQNQKFIEALKKT